MGIIFSGMFWGIFLVFGGLSILAKMIFHVDIPVFRIMFALLLIYLGFKVLFGGSFWRVEKHINIEMGNYHYDHPQAGGKYDVVFGNGDLDLTGFAWNQADTALAMNAVFSNAKLKLNPAIPTLVRANAVFSNVSLPDGNTPNFGGREYRNKAFQEGKPCLTVNVNAVFGALEVEE